MRSRQILGVGILLGGLAALVGHNAGVQAQKPAAKFDPIVERIAELTKLKPEDVDKVWRNQHQAITDQIRKGSSVQMPQLGRLQVVRIPEHKDLQNGKPVTIQATNVIEFEPDSGLDSAANAPGAVPARTAGNYEFNPLPDQTPGQKMGRTRVPSTRVK